MLLVKRDQCLHTDNQKWLKFRPQNFGDVSIIYNTWLYRCSPCIVIMQPPLDVTKENRLFDIFVTENTSKENKCLFFTEFCSKFHTFMCCQSVELNIIKSIEMHYRLGFCDLITTQNIEEFYEVFCLQFLHIIFKLCLASIFMI